MAKNSRRTTLERIDERLDSIDKTLIKQEENLKQHMYRTELAEKRLELIEGDLKPVKIHVNSITTLGKFLMWAVGSGVVIAIIELVK